MTSPPPAAREKRVITEVLPLPESYRKSEVGLWPLDLRANGLGQPVRPQGYHNQLRFCGSPIALPASAPRGPLRCQTGPGLTAWARVRGLSSIQNSQNEWLITRLPPVSAKYHLAQIYPKETFFSGFCFPTRHSHFLCPQHATKPLPRVTPGWQRESLSVGGALGPEHQAAGDRNIPLSFRELAAVKRRCRAFLKVKSSGGNRQRLPSTSLGHQQPQ